MFKNIFFVTLCTLLTYCCFAQGKNNNVLFPVLKNFTLGFIDNTGKIVVDYKYEIKQREEIQQMKDGLIAFRKNKKWGFINAKGTEIVPPIYDIVSGFNNDYCMVGNLKPGQTNPKYGSFYGVIDNTGIEVVPLKYEEAQFSMHAGNYFLTFKKNRATGFVNIQTGKEGNKLFAEILPFVNDQAPVKDAKSKKWGLVNGEGDWLFEPKFEYVDHIGLPFIYQISGPDGQWALGSDSGIALSEIVEYNRVATNEFAKFSNGRLVIKDDTKKYGYVDDSVGLVIPCKFTVASTFYNKVAIVNEGGLITKTIANYPQVSGGKWSLINTDGDPIVTLPNIEEFRAFSEGLAAVKIGGLWGFINDKGALVVKPSFKETPEPFTNGLSLVSNLPTWNNKFGYINKEGKIIKALE